MMNTPQTDQASAPQINQLEWLKIDSFEEVDELKRKVVISLAGSEVDTRWNKKINETASKVKMQGFRPGKVPIRVVERRWGESFKAEVLEELVDEGYKSVISEKDLKVAGQIRISDLNEETADNAWKAIAEFEIFPSPKFDDEGLTSVAAEKLVLKATDDEIQERVDSVRESVSPWVAKKAIIKTASGKDAPKAVCAKGDRVRLSLFMDFPELESAKTESDTAEDDEREALERDFVLSEGQLPEPVLEKIIGSKVGDKGQADINASIGQQVTWRWEVLNLEERDPLPWDSKELWEQLKTGLNLASEASTEGEESVAEKVLSGKELRAAVEQKCREVLEKEAQNVSDRHLRDQIFKQWMELHPLPMPQVAVERELSALKEQLARQQGQPPPPDEGEEANKEDDPLWDDALSRVRLGILVAAFAETNNLKVDDTWIMERISADAVRSGQPDEFRKWAFQDENYLRNLEAEGLQEQVFRSLLTKVKVTDKPYTFKEFQDFRSAQ